MAEPKQLSFVWELNNNGVISHAIGCHHYIPQDVTFDIRPYSKKDMFLFEKVKNTNSIEREKELQKECTKLMNKVSALKNSNSLSEIIAKFTETQVNTLQHLVKHYSIIETAFQEYAQHNNIICESLETASEHKQLFDAYSKRPKSGLSGDIAEEFLLGNLEKLKQLCEQDEQFMEKYLNRQDYAYHQGRNYRMFQRSLQYITKPCNVLVGVAHLLVEPSLLTFYKSNGIIINFQQNKN